MKKTLIITALLVAVLFLAFIGYNSLYDRAAVEETTAAASTDTTAGEQTQAGVAPDFSVLSYDGETVKLSDNFGKPIILNFWATWCSPCKSELPAFEEAYKKYGDQISFMFINLTDGRDTEEAVRDFIAENGYTFPVYFDKNLDASMLYGATTIPLTVFINADGTVNGYQYGRFNEENLNLCIEDLLN